MVHYAWSCLILGWRALSSMTWSRNQQQFSLRLSEATRVSAWTRSRLLLPQQDGPDHNTDAWMLELHWTVNTHANTNVLKKNVLNLQVEWLFWYLVCSDYRLQMRIQPNLRKGRGCPHVGGALWDWRMFGLKPPLALRVHVTEAEDLFGQKQKNTLYSSFSSQTQSWVQTRETRVPGASPCTKMSSKGHWRILWLFPNHLWLVRHSGRRQIPDLMRKGLFHLPTGV